MYIILDLPSTYDSEIMKMTIYSFALSVSVCKHYLYKKLSRKEEFQI